MAIVRSMGLSHYEVLPSVDWKSLMMLIFKQKNCIGDVFAVVSERL